MKQYGLALAVCTCWALPAAAQQAGDFTGWVYQDSGGDFPIRLHVYSSEHGLEAELDLPHMNRSRMPMSVEQSSTGLRLRSPASPMLGFEGSFVADLVAGRCTIGGQPLGDFELHRSPLPLPDVDPGRYADHVGSYRFPSGRVLVVTERFWGEIMYLDTQSGRNGTLFPLDEDRFFAGSAMYVPAPVTALCTFESDHLVWDEPGSPPETASRVDLVETELEFESEGVRLVGTLIHPEGSSGSPAVVILGGSDWTTRGSQRRQALIWASAGIAAFVYDKRGFGGSGGAETVPFAATAADARAAARMLAARDEVDGRRIGVTGTSRGGWFAPLAAAGDSPFALCVLFVAPAVSPARQETTRRLNEMRREGYGADEVVEAAAHLEAMWRFGAEEDRVEEYRLAFERVRGRPWASTVDVMSPDDDWSWVRANMAYDPEPTLRRVQVPVLAVYGEKDMNVVPADSAPILERAMAAAGNKDCEIIIVPGVDHGLRLVDQDVTRAWSHRAQGYAPGMWDRVVRWFVDRMAVR